MVGMRPSAWWGVALALTAAAPAGWLGTVWLTSRQLRSFVRSFAPPTTSGYSANFTHKSLSVLEPTIFLAPLGLLLGWTALVLAVVAWRRTRAGALRMVLGGLFGLLFLPTLALSFAGLW